MWHKNNGQSEDEILQNRFTAYLSKAIQRQRKEYILHAIRQKQIEKLLGELAEIQKCDFAWEEWNELPLLMRLENESLLYALKGLTERERYVLLARILDERSFEEIANRMGMSYKGAATIYYRALQKIRNRMEEVDDEF